MSERARAVKRAIIQVLQVAINIDDANDLLTKVIEDGIDQAVTAARAQDAERIRGEVLAEARQIAVDECWQATDMSAPYGRGYHAAAKAIAQAIERLALTPPPAAATREEAR